MENVQSVMRGQHSTRILFILCGAVLLIIVGLLGMHTFSSEAAGHGTASVSHSAVASNHSEAGVAGTLSDPSAECSGTCQPSTSPAPEHQEMVTACVLALLVGILLLAPPVLLHRFGSVLWRPAGLWLLMSTSILPREPSLITLSISRT
ncbi:DUF6153 family protein [Leucobacter sp.]|nr:hypothetical protein [Microbacteriaceae bacterium]